MSAHHELVTTDPKQDCPTSLVDWLLDHPEAYEEAFRWGLGGDRTYVIDLWSLHERLTQEPSEEEGGLPLPPDDAMAWLSQITPTDTKWLYLSL